MVIIVVELGRAPVTVSIAMRVMARPHSRVAVLVPPFHFQHIDIVAITSKAITVGVACM